ncbi:hypothetical protein BJ984_003461 [Herbiconiux flava]|uniref:HNH endonuclease n=1 Tax=Herbiconiux flava TaxID=881268 RepID=A0A852SU98_9MICO|nr:hypothetical protein [Herbiconiux flava]GLK17734.1 hypothetical protein GCM10017602_22160 [Herbiconiux flava]
MSQHHRKQKWSTHSPKLRKLHKATLPQTCTNCPHPVTADMEWQVGHRQDAAMGGQPTYENTGPAHSMCPWCKRRCNQVAGGRLGAAMTNRAKRTEREQDSYRGRRRWV